MVGVATAGAIILGSIGMLIVFVLVLHYWEKWERNKMTTEINDAYQNLC